jgi:hypothetical protein
MLLNQPESPEPRFDPFDDLSRYEKGVVARAFLMSLINQGCLTSTPSDGVLGEVVISVNQWQLKLLARFNINAELVEEEEENLLYNLDQIC